MPKHVLTTMLVCSAMGAFACNASNAPRDQNGNDTAKSRTEAAKTEDAAPKTQPISITGCLQKDGRDYIVTRINEPSSRPVATSGGSNGSVQNEQLREAASAYRVNPSDDSKIDDLVGKKVEVAGTLTERAELTRDGDETRATSGSKADTDAGRARTDIKNGDLARITATSVTKVADNCGQGKRS